MTWFCLIIIADISIWYCFDRIFKASAATVALKGQLSSCW